jgi:hypothetical protein
MLTYTIDSTDIERIMTIDSYCDCSESHHVLSAPIAFLHKANCFPRSWSSTENTARVPQGRSKIRNFRDDETLRVSNHLTPRVNRVSPIQTCSVRSMYGSTVRLLISPALHRTNAPKSRRPKESFQQWPVLFPHLSGGDALNRPNDLNRRVLRVSRQEQMHVVRGDMQRENIVSVPFGYISDTPLNRGFDPVQYRVSVFRAPNEVIVDRIDSVGSASNSHAQYTSPVCLRRSSAYAACEQKIHCHRLERRRGVVGRPTTSLSEWVAPKSDSRATTKGVRIDNGPHASLPCVSRRRYRERSVASHQHPSADSQPRRPRLLPRSSKRPSECLQPTSRTHRVETTVVDVRGRIGHTANRR